MRSSTSDEVLAEVAGEVVERPARGRHVDEPEERRAQLGVARGQLHRALVDGLERVPRARGKRVRELAPDALDIRFQQPRVQSYSRW